MQPPLFLTLTLLGWSAAQSTTVSLFLPNTDQQSLVASVVAADATATTYVISCPPGTDSSNCGYGGGATVVEGPSTVQMVLLSSNVPLETIACDLAGTTQAVCTTSQTLQGFGTSQVVTSTLGPADMTYFPVGITAGAEKLGPASGAVSATASSPAGAGSSASTTATGVVGSISVAVSSTSAAAASVTGAGRSSSQTAASLSASSMTGPSSISHTQAASATASSASNAASRAELSLLAVAVRCVFGGMLAVPFL